MSQTNESGLTALEICAGGGGQAIGLEQAGFGHAAAVDNDEAACETLRQNRPDWKVVCADLREVNGRKFRGIDLLAGGVPCPPFSIAGRQLGPDDERDLFPTALRLVSEAKPVAVMLENVRGLGTARFAQYRKKIVRELDRLGYDAYWSLLNAADYGVPQLRPRTVLVALRRTKRLEFAWPNPKGDRVTVGAAIGDLMGSRGWPGTARWLTLAEGIAPTIVGGSKKHGGPDLGPTRAKREWARLGVDGLGIANEPPGPDFPSNGLPRLTNRMVARIQGFPDDWQFCGGKTAAYRQIGNAFPPPVARAVGLAVAASIHGKQPEQSRPQLALFGNRPIAVEILRS